MSPMGSDICILGPQLVVLLGALGGTDLLEDIHYYIWNWSFQFALPAWCLRFRVGALSFLFLPPCLLLAGVIPGNDELLSFWKLKLK